tara:strand:- start:1511 stop:1780 length:270 start_codon:yes stop_codon:yes gene_type:complete
MGWSEWMVVELPLEEQLILERQVRAVHDHTDTEAIAKLCGTLIRQNYHQQKLLQQALKRIIELEVIDEVDLSSEQRLPWWQQLLMRVKS